MRARASGSLFTNCEIGDGSENGAGVGADGLPRYDGTEAELAAFGPTGSVVPAVVHHGEMIKVNRGGTEEVEGGRSDNDECK